MKDRRFEYTTEMPAEIYSAIKDIVWMARRYCNKRKTYAPSMFNDAYDVLSKYIDFHKDDDADNPKNRKCSKSGFEEQNFEDFPHASVG